MKFMVTTQDRPNNYPIYSIHSDLDSFILYNDISAQEQVPNHNTPLCLTDDGQTLVSEQDNSDEVLWNLSFDGSVSKEGASVGVWGF